MIITSHFSGLPLMCVTTGITVAWLHHCKLSSGEQYGTFWPSIFYAKKSSPEHGVLPVDVIYNSCHIENSGYE